MSSVATKGRPKKAEAKEQAAPPPRRKGLIIIIVLVFFLGLVLLGGGVAAYFLRDYLPFDLPLPWLGNGEEDTASVTEVPEDPPRYAHEMREFQVNLADSGARNFLRMNIELAYDDRGLGRELEERDSELRTLIIAHLRSKTVEDLNEPGGMETLGEELTLLLNEILRSGEIRAVYYKDFIYQ